MKAFMPLAMLVILAVLAGSVNAQSVDHPPVMDYVSITPSSPEDYDTLACAAHASDQDANLERVVFRWFVEGGLDRIRTVYVSGGSATVQDSLDSSRSGLGEEVRCEATVYDYTGLQDSGSDTVTIDRQGCGIDVYLLEVVDNNRIRFRVRNTGGSAEDITFRIYVDGALIRESSIALDSGEVEILQESYAFGIGEFIVKVKATTDCGSTDSETMIHKVLDPYTGPGDENPVVDSVRITPSSPDEWDDLTCRVEVSDDQRDLDKVQMKWYVEGYLERTRTIYVSGGSDDVTDILGSGWFGRGDEVRCNARVFDRDGNEDSDSDVVTIGGEKGCGVDVYNLEFIDNNEIRFRVRNTGDGTESINYKVYVEGELIIQHNILLDEDEWEIIEESFSFDISDSLIKVKVTADCGSTDSEFLSGGIHGICQKKYLDEYKCSGDWVQRKYQYSDCSIVWVNSEFCASGCSNGYCVGTGGQCGVSIQKFDYQTSVVAGNAATVSVEARNTGNRQETITLSLWVDGVLKESYPAFVNPGYSSVRTFYYYPAAGTHQVMVKAQADCGSWDSRTATVNVFQPGQPSPYPYPSPAPQPAPSLPTSVSIYPSSLDTSLCEARFVTIDIHNAVEQVYTIQVTGVPAEWVSYQSQNIVKAGDRQLFVYAGPKEQGTYSIRVSVRAETEKKDFVQDVSIYTASCTEKPVQDGGITGSIIEAAKNPFFWIVLIIMAGAIVIFVGVTRLRPDEEFYETEYPYRRYRAVRRDQ